MGAEHRKILEMLAAGKLNAEEANQLLEALGSEVQAERDVENEKEAWEISHPTPRSRPTKKQKLKSKSKSKLKQKPKLQKNFGNGFARLEPDKLVQFKIHGVDRDYVIKMRELDA